MRIIGGFLKGRKIFDAVDKSTRPLKDMVRGSIFNILDHSKNEGINFKKSKILDLFSGTGSFGLECISKGASKVIFFENYKQSYEVLTENINKLNCINETVVYEKNAYNCFDISEIKKLASLPTYDEAIAMLMSVMQAPLQKLMATMNAVPTKIVRTLDAIKQSKD